MRTLIVIIVMLIGVAAMCQSTTTYRNRTGSLVGRSRSYTVGKSTTTTYRDKVGNLIGRSKTYNATTTYRSKSGKLIGRSKTYKARKRCKRK